MVSLHKMCCFPTSALKNEQDFRGSQTIATENNSSVISFFSQKPGGQTSGGEGDQAPADEEGEGAHPQQIAGSVAVASETDQKSCFFCS